MKLSSPKFEQFKQIPSRFTCEGEDLSPPLNIDEVPTGTQTFALIVEDPDAPSGLFIHWVGWNLPGESSGLLEGQKMPREGRNGFGSNGYRGPCPPPGKPHRYFFRVFALDAILDLAEGASKAALERAMEDHILAQAELVGTYKR